MNKPEGLMETVNSIQTILEYWKLVNLAHYNPHQYFKLFLFVNCVNSEKDSNIEACLKGFHFIITQPIIQKFWQVY